MTDHGDILVTYVLDRSGSMFDIWQATKTGFSEFVASQAEQPGTAYVTLVTFDDQSIDTLYERCEASAITGAIPDDVAPRGMTPLHDAIGQAVAATEQAVSDLDWSGKVVVAINTDGLENASTEYTLGTIRSLIESKQSEGWEFVFMGAGIDAYQEGTKLGVRGQATMSYDSNPVSTRTAYAGLSASVSTYRGADQDATVVFDDPNGDT